MNENRKYHLGPADLSTFKGKDRHVYLDNGVIGETRIHFKCPCGERLVCVASPPHNIDFDNDILTVTGSIGSREDKRLIRKSNWCHFYIKDGDFEICSDSECPGKDL